MLIPTADLRVALGYADNTNDAKVISAGTVAQALMERYTARRFMRGEYVDEIDGPRSGSYYTRQLPLHSLTSLYVNGAVRSLSGVTFMKNTARVMFGARGFWLNRGEIALLTYNAGYDPLPDDLRHVYIEVSRAALGQQAATALTGASGSGASASSGQAVKSMTIPEVLSVTFESTSDSSASSGLQGSEWATGILGPWIPILDLYRSERTLTSFR